MSYDPTKDPHLADWRERGAMGIRKMRCPQCGQVGYKPYIYPDGQRIDDICGKCDHETGCGYHLTPREYFKDHKQEGDHTNPNYVPPPPPPMVVIASEIAAYYYCLRPGAPRNPLLRYWIDLIRDNRDEKKVKQYTDNFLRALRQFNVGTVQGGYTLWWIVDEELRIRTGKMMKYKADGHRDKTDKKGFSWIHNQPWAKVGQLPGAEYVGCLFGLHQLKLFPKLTEVQIVESEKTAVLMTMFKPSMTWMATMGIGALNAQRLDPIIQRGITIVCHPDYDGRDKWQEKIDRVREDNPKAKIYLSDYVERHYHALPPNADILDEMERDYILWYSYKIKPIIPLCDETEQDQAAPWPEGDG